VAGLLVLIGLAGLVIGGIAAAKSGIRGLRIGSRKQGVAVLLAGLALSIAGGALAPPQKVSSAKGPSSTESTTSPSPTPASGGALPSPSSPSKSLATPTAVARTMTPAPVATQSIPAPRTTTNPPLAPSTPPPAAIAPPPALAASCSASISNPTPGDGGSETLYVTSNVPNTSVRLVIHYKTKNSSYSGATDPSGAGSVTFGIGRPTIGYTVIVDVTVGQQASCSTAFTPQ
jgi:hypothetical protein